jgi:arylsulfatase
MCTSSRSVLLTGLQTADNRMFENTNVPWQTDMSTELPTFGDMLRKAGYYTAYKGKWHLNDDFDVEEPRRLFVDEMEAYGFSDYFAIGDVIGHELGGYENDHMVAGNAIRWMRAKGQELNDAGTPWALTVSLVNPHDVMYFNTDLPNESVQDPGNLLFKTARAPNHEHYKKTWDMPLPDNLRQSFDEPGRPSAHGEYQAMWSVLLGAIPYEDERWTRLNDYYINCIRDVDLQIARLLNELDALGLADRTIVVYSTDHGEMAGAHGLHGKGPYAYEESIHLPFYIVHPDVKGGQDCRALTGHIDVAPTLLSLAGMDVARRGEAAGRDLPGKDLSVLLRDPGNAQVTALHDGVLFTYSGMMTNDAELFRRISAAVASGQQPKSVLADGYRPDLKKRGSMRAVFDGRYKFSRYFGPVERNRPTTLDRLYAHNDVELFDVEADPAENTNLAAKKGDDEALVMAMNAKLNALMDDEFGPDDGREMPDIEGIDWAVEKVDI